MTCGSWLRRRPFIQPAFAFGGGRMAKKFQRLADKVKRAGNDDEGIARCPFQRLIQAGARKTFRRGICGATRHGQFVCAGGTFACDGNGENPPGQRRKHFANVLPVLVLEHSQNQRAPHCWKVFLQGIAQSLRPGNVVRPVEQDFLAVRPLNQLQSSRPVDVYQTVVNCFMADWNLTLQNFNRRQRQRCIQLLMVAQQSSDRRRACF